MKFGFGDDWGEELPSYFVAVKSDRMKFDVDDVTMTFFYGSYRKNGYQPKLEAGESFKLIVEMVADSKIRKEIESFTAEEFYTEKCQVIITKIIHGGI